MLLELTRWLEQLQRLFGLFNYLTFRGILSALTALSLSLWWGPAMIRKLAEFKGQPIRTDGPQTHFTKAGTPTMGGALILLTVLASVLLWADLRNKYVGRARGDDRLRRDRLVRRLGEDRPSRPERDEVALEVPVPVAARLAAGIYLYAYADVPAATTFYVPLFKFAALPLAGIGFVAIAYFWIVGFSNAVNLTDGLDGLAIMPSVLVACALGIFAYASGHAEFSRYLQIPSVPGAASWW